MLEYNSVVWSPHLKCDIERIENVQRQFIKRLYGFKHVSYKDRLTKLRIPSLEFRRLYLDLTYCYKIVFGFWTHHLNMTDYFEFRSLQAREDMHTNSGVARILCQGAQVWHREKTENNKCISYHPRQQPILTNMRHCIRPVCHSHSVQ